MQYYIRIFLQGVLLVTLMSYSYDVWVFHANVDKDISILIGKYYWHFSRHLPCPCGWSRQWSSELSVIIYQSAQCHFPCYIMFKSDSQVSSCMWASLFVWCCNLQLTKIVIWLWVYSVIPCPVQALGGLITVCWAQKCVVETSFEIQGYVNTDLCWPPTGHLKYIFGH